MTKMNAVVGNTIDFSVEVDDLSDSPTEVWLELYRAKEYKIGLSDVLIKTVPVSVANGVAFFVFESEPFASIPITIYGRFFVEDSEKKINAYFTLKFKY